MEDKELYEKILNGLGDEQFDSMEKAISESNTKPKQTSLPLLLKEYKLKRQLSNLRDDRLEQAIKSYEEKVRHKKELDELRLKTGNSIIREKIRQNFKPQA